MVMPEIALEPDISGVWSCGGTLAIISKPTNIASSSVISGTAPGLPSDAVLWIRLAQVNAIVGSSYAIFWISSVAAWSREKSRGGSTEAGDPALMVQVALPVALIGFVLVAGFAGLFVDPSPTLAREAIADAMGWLAFALASGAAVVLARRSGRGIGLGPVAPIATSTAAMLAFGSARVDSGDWLVLHAMIVAQAGAAGGLLLLGWNRRGLKDGEDSGRGGRAITLWSTLATAAVALQALRSYGSDPVDPLWWAVGALATSVALAAALAGWSARRGFVYAAGGLLNLVTSLWWFEAPNRWPGGGPSGFVMANIIAATLPVPAWLWLELRAIRPAGGLEPRGGPTPFHRVAAVGLAPRTRPDGSGLAAGGRDRRVARPGPGAQLRGDDRGGCRRLRGRGLGQSLAGGSRRAVRPGPLRRRMDDRRARPDAGDAGLGRRGRAGELCGDRLRPLECPGRLAAPRRSARAPGRRDGRPAGRRPRLAGAGKRCAVGGGGRARVRGRPDGSRRAPPLLLGEGGPLHGAGDRPAGPGGAVVRAAGDSPRLRCRGGRGVGLGLDRAGLDHGDARPRRRRARLARGDGRRLRARSGHARPEGNAMGAGRPAARAGAAGAGGDRPGRRDRRGTRRGRGGRAGGDVGRGAGRHGRDTARRRGRGVWSRPSSPGGIRSACPSDGGRPMSMPPRACSP